jgi:P4 family phage/plasmid primase-like protien
MKNEIKKYHEKNLVTFSINITQKLHKSGKWKKEIMFPPGWQGYTLTKSYYNENYNGLAFPTGKINNIIVIDIDNTEHWELFLKEHNHKEPDTVSAISGSGGKHLYFRYSDDYEEIKSNCKCFGNEYDIDIRTNGGCIIVPPTKYFNKNMDREVEYIWEKSIFEHEIKSIPIWMKKLLLNKKQNEKNIEMLEKKIKTSQQNKASEIIANLQSTEINEEDSELDFSADEIETLVNMLSESRCENYNEWVNIGMCLFNINKYYLNIWIRWSKKSEKYEDGGCESKWKSFKKTKEGLKIGSLLLWAKSDSPLKYEMFIKKKKLNGMIYSKYPDDKLVLGETVVVNEKCQYTHLKNRECLIKGCEHDDMKQTMYVEVLDKFMTIKCRHPECFGKTYPCNHILMTKNEMNIAFNGDITININNNQDDELVEFQQIDIYEDPKVNELVFNGLNGESYPFAKIIHYYYANMFNYGEDENWYIYANHKWKNIGKKNIKLRDLTQSTLKDLYSELLKYYKENDFDKHKIKSLKQTITSFDNTVLKNNILTELCEIYMINNNPEGNFTTKLDSNNYLIGFDNGVYDLQKFEFREGNPNDYITLTVGYEYKEQHTEKYAGLLQFLEDIQPNKEERDYMLTYLSIGLVGNLLELFTILTGSGRNGKSKLIELLKITLGDYFGSVQSQLFTRPRPDANSPDPGLLSLMRKRIVMASEPEKNSKLNSGFIKFITGRDSTTLRNCHSNDMIDFTANFETLLICNDIPDCDDIDNAFSKRLRCINFPTEFVSEPTKENQKKIDVNINKNFDHWKLDFVLLLIDYYKKYSQTHELKPTNNILKWTDQYKEETDIYLQFLNENTEESTTHIKTSDVYEVFKEWFRTNNPHNKIPTNREFISNIKKYKNVEHVKVDKTTCYGFKNLKIKEI